MAEIRADYARYCKWERGGAAGRARVKGARAVVQESTRVSIRRRKTVASYLTFHGSVLQEVTGNRRD